MRRRKQQRRPAPERRADDSGAVGFGRVEHREQVTGRLLHGRTELSLLEQKPVRRAVAALVEDDEPPYPSETPEETLDLRDLPHQVDRRGPVRHQHDVHLAATHDLVGDARAVRRENEARSRCYHSAAPLARMFSPETHRAWSLARNATTSAMSCGSAR